MKAITILCLVLTASAVDFDPVPRPERCLKTTKKITVVLYDIAFDIYHNPFFPDYHQFEKLLDAVQAYVEKCLEKPWAISFYKPCVPQLLAIYPYLVKAWEDLQEGDYKAVLLSLKRIDDAYKKARLRCKKLETEQK